MKKTFLITFVICAIMCLVLVDKGYAESVKKPYSPFEIDKLDAKPAPDFSLTDLNGNKFALSSLKGKAVILHFWATWCPACISEMPSLNSLNGTMKPRGLEIVAVSADRSAKDVKDYLAKKGFALQVLVDERREVTGKFKVFSLPTTFFINRQGVIVEKLFGEYDWNDREMRAKVEKLL